MKEIEKDIMCVLLRSLMNKNLITQSIYNQAREKIIGTLDESEFFCYGEEKRKENADGYTQNSC